MEKIERVGGGVGGDAGRKGRVGQGGNGEGRDEIEECIEGGREGGEIEKRIGRVARMKGIEKDKN